MATARAETADQPRASEPGEPPVLHEGTDNVLLQLIIFQGFLVEFNTPDVHRAFLRGEFGVPENDEIILDTIRHICRMLLPPLRPRAAGGGGAGCEPQRGGAVWVGVVCGSPFEKRS
jgi:hypothetical protein